MAEYSPELRAKVDALRESVNDAGRTYVERMGALFSLANAIAPYTAHIDAQAERIAELERENARLREGLDKLALELREYSEQWKDEGVASVIASRVARALGNYASDVSTNRYALKDTAQ